jgi:DNA-binding transcriptional LysR family regulator
MLFDRSARSIVLYTAGRSMVAPVTELVTRYEALAAYPGEAQLGGTLVMGALVSALMGAFADCLWALKKSHPALEVTLLAGQSAEFALRVERGELDAAVVTQPPGRLVSNLVWTPLYSEPMVMIVPRHPHFELPRQPQEILTQCPFIRFDHQLWTGQLVDKVIAAERATVLDAMELNSVEAIIALVRQGFGISIVPQLANVQWSRDRALRIVPLEGATVQRHVGLLERRQYSRQRFTQAIKDYFPKGSAGRPARTSARPGPKRR